MVRRSLEKWEVLLVTGIVGSLSLLGIPSFADNPPARDPVTQLAVAETVTPDSPESNSDDDIREAILVRQEPPQVRPAEPVRPEAPTPAGATQRVAGLFGPSQATKELLAADRKERATRPGSDAVLGSESMVRPSSDAGSLLGKSQTTTGVEVQRRTPIVTDPRSRGTRTGQLLASGSYWIPARQDLDTMLSKLDSSVISDLIVIKGPYSARYGPGFSFIDAELLRSPRYENGLEWHGRTNLNLQTNGEQWYGRQTLLGGSTDWGLRVGYGHRTGNDYESGDGTELPSSYNSRDSDVAIGFDLSPDEHIEFSYLRLDQTGVEFPGQIFDIRFLVSDAYELKYTLDNQCYFDRLTLEGWYNRTRFEGDAEGSGKRRQIPELNCPTSPAPCLTGAPIRPGGVLGFIGLTDVDSMSTGYRAAVTWGEADCPQLTVGADLRYLKQQLNELDRFQLSLDTDGDGVLDFAVPAGGNFPIPRSHSADPGIFVEHVLPLGERLVVKSGARVDWVSDNIEGTPPGASRARLEQELGSTDFDKEFNPWAVYTTGEYKVDCNWTASAGFGYAMRPPTLTELYADQPFLAILQQGFTTVRGNPNLDPERLWQIDVGLKADYGRLRTGANGFYAIIHDYITYNAVGNLAGVPDGLQVKYTNTDHATLAGGELFGEVDLNCWLTPFATMSYVEGRDHSRSDRFTQDNFFPSIPLLNGHHDVIAQGRNLEEPLPGIAPLESHLGLRIHEPCEKPRWGIELAARVVDNQDRVAASLLERETAGFTTWDIRSYWQASDRLLLVAGVENFTDKQYHEHLDLRTGHGVSQPGVNFYFGAELSY